MTFLTRFFQPLLQGLGLSLALLAGTATAAAAAYPDKTIRLVLPLAPGGAMDVLGRALAQELGTRWNVPVVVENRAGAGGIIAADLVARSAPDGYTLLLTGDALVSAVTLFAGKANYDPVKSFAPITIAATTNTVLVVREDSPAATLKDLVALAGTRRVNVATPGHGNNNHFALVSLQRGVQGEFQHVPYKGAGPAVVGLLAGEADAAIVAVPAASQLIRGGKLRALAVFQGRSGVLPEVPTVQEAGYALDTKTGWFGLLAPAGTPTAVVATLQQAIAAAIGDDKFRKTLVDHGFEPVGSSTADFAARLQNDTETLPALLASVGVKVD